MFGVNDVVCYGAQGVCRITALEMRSFGGAEELYYILAPLGTVGATIYVPADNEMLTGRMRHILSPEEIDELIREVLWEQPEWEADENRRKAYYHELLGGGDRRALIRQIKALYQHRNEQEKRDRRLHACDERFLKDAEKLLYDEFALVLHIRHDQVLPLIMEQLPESERKTISERK